MSVKSTYTITKELAISILLSKMITAKNEEIADMLEALPESEFRNYFVVDILPKNSKEYDKIFEIETINQFNEK